MNKQYKNIKTGVIGVGSMGQNHARVYNEISNLVGVADTDESQARKIADRLGVKYYKNYEEMLKEVDAVTIAVPTIYHREVAKICSESRVHIMLEKPISNNIQDSKEIVNNAEDAGIKLAIGHIETQSSSIFCQKFDY